MTRILLAAAAVLAISAAEAQAQYGRYDDDDGPRRYERRYDGDRYERRRDRYDEDRYERRGRARGGSICVTARGNCVTRPGPFNTPCGCEVPGFGYKRGAIGG